MYISLDKDNSTISTNDNVDAALIASIADDKPYNNTTEFLLDLNHEKII
jgi:hypothetical protein